MVQEPVFRLKMTTVVSETPRETHARELSMMRFSTPALLNLPGGLLGLARSDWVPKGMLPQFWRLISWPFIGIIFWWIAGRGIEALISSRWRVFSPAITWVEVVVASLVMAFGAFLCIGFLFDPNMREDFIYSWPLATVASGLWILLGAATVAARLAQSRNRRQLRSEPGTTPA
jgi:hypothetical protein